MFTGIIESLGTIDSIRQSNGGMHVRIASAGLDMSSVNLGDSIAVNGVCLTVTEFSSNYFCADISAESLRHTRLANVQNGEKVNLEKALTLAKPLGGHLVSGHVDGLGTIVHIGSDGAATRYTVECEANLLPYIANKGSICIDGVSLTITGLLDNGFTLNIVPHTSENTIIPSYVEGHSVHIEIDLMARYAERLLQMRGLNDKPHSVIDTAFLAKNGYKV